MDPLVVFSLPGAWRGHRDGAGLSWILRCPAIHYLAAIALVSS